MEIADKLAILADAAKYDASCASSGSRARRPKGEKGIGSTEGMGICHSYTPDGRCVSLLKILLTNACMYDCACCINRRSSGTRRARFTPEEVVRLTLDFYRRNYIEGLFLSSGIVRSSDHTMEQLVRVARALREEHGFAGYIHLKTIPGASPELLAEAGRWADRLSVNVELPSQAELDRLAPEKQLVQITGAMDRVRDGIDAARAERRVGSGGAPERIAFAPAGQSTQMIVGATEASDGQILTAAHTLYGRQRLRRVYYSAFSPIPDSPSHLPSQPAPLLREHRLYQADWLMRFYGFDPAESAADEPALALFEDAAPAPKTAPVEPAHRVPRRFVELGAAVACHRDAGRWGLLYRVLWRLTNGEPKLLEVEVDEDVRRLIVMERGVRRAAHKMKAFVRFRATGGDGDPFVAWFDPEHAVLPAVAPFFARRFATMHWSILTPDGCAHWDGAALRFTPGLPRSAAPADDAIEALWRTYYAHIFNPARVKLKAMRSEMPKRYWTELPEAAQIPELVRDAPARVRRMVEEAGRAP